MNCGWENPDGQQKCEKCNSQLEGRQEKIMPQREPELGINLKGTISEAQVFAEPSPISSDSQSCPRCGFPIRNGVKKCPNCGESIVISNVEVQSKPSVTPKVNPNHNATVNPWLNPINNSFSLQPIAWENEKQLHDELIFSGEKIDLNRNNTDSLNNTITSKVQAEITYENGRWYIEDKSAQNTTFVYAGRKLNLEDGDTIMLGNRKFVFKIK